MASVTEDGGAFVANDVDRTSFTSTSYRRQTRKLDAFLERHQQTKITSAVTQTTCSSSLSHQGQSHSGVIVGETDDMSSTIFPNETYDTQTQSHCGPGVNHEEEWHDSSASEVNRLDVLPQKERHQTTARVATGSSTEQHFNDNDVILGTGVMFSSAQEGNVTTNLHSPLTIESSTHTKSTVSKHISTPREASNTSCSFRFNFLSAIFKPETNREDDESSKGNNASPIFSASSSSESFSSESYHDRDMFAASGASEDIELNNYYDEGENGRASMQWTFDDSEAGTDAS